MKKVMLFSLLSVSVVAFSCKKNDCAQCHYDKDGGTIEIGERCGDDLKQIEASGYAADGQTYTVHCGEDH